MNKINGVAERKNSSWSDAFGGDGLLYSLLVFQWQMLIEATANELSSFVLCVTTIFVWNKFTQERFTSNFCGWKNATNYTTT